MRPTEARETASKEYKRAGLPAGDGEQTSTPAAERIFELSSDTDKSKFGMKKPRFICVKFIPYLYPLK